MTVKRATIIIGNQGVCKKFFLGVSQDVSNYRSDSYYWTSKQLRGEVPMSTSVPPDRKTKTILDTYWHSGEPGKAGEVETIAKRLPESFVEDVRNVQNCIYDEIIKRGIFIETNPT